MWSGFPVKPAWGFGWEEFVFFHVLVFSQFFFYVCFLLRTKCVCLSLSLFASSILILFLYLFGKLISMNIPLLAALTHCSNFKWCTICVIDLVGVHVWHLFPDSGLFNTSTHWPFVAHVEKNNPTITSFLIWNCVFYNFYKPSKQTPLYWGSCLCTSLSQNSWLSYCVIIRKYHEVILCELRQMKFKRTDNSGDF